MIQASDYFLDDIEKFLQINRKVNREAERKIVQNILDVQDKISIFKGIEPQELKAIIYNLKFVKYKFKDYIIKQDDISEEIFYIISGGCHVFHDNLKVGELGQGEVFGEAGAIFKTKRNASVVCASQELTILSFNINGDNMDFCAPALARLYKNLALQINTKLESINCAYVKK